MCSPNLLQRDVLKTQCTTPHITSATAKHKERWGASKVMEFPAHLVEDVTLQLERTVQCRNNNTEY